MKNKHEHFSGFTIVEMLAVMAMIGVLAMLTVPAYTEYVKESRRIDATATLVEYATQQELFFSRKDTYTNSVNGAKGLNLSSETPEGYYSITANACPGGDIATCFQLTAVARSGEAQINDKDCRTFTIDSRGIKTARSAALGDTTDECW